MLFFPSHDIALANGVRHFNPPAAALRLQEDLASLSHIWNHPFEQGKTAFPQPWGWDWDTRQHLHKSYHVKMSQLPTDEDLEAIRQLSSRSTTIQLIQRLNDETGMHFPLPCFMQDMKAVTDFILAHEEAKKGFVLKTPWSSSGRGLTRSDVPKETILKHAQATINKMGGIMGEDWIENKVQDFAMLFFVSDHEVQFLGYSLFDNDGTTYRQGYLMSNEKIAQRLSLDQQLLTLVSESYVKILTHLFAPFFGRPWQLGYVGIDMMTYTSNPATHSNTSTHSNLSDSPNHTLTTHPSLALNPCIEMNLRCTMGVVCRLWYDEHQQEGIFRISPMEGNGHFRAEFI